MAVEALLHVDVASRVSPPSGSYSQEAAPHKAAPAPPHPIQCSSPGPGILFCQCACTYFLILFQTNVQFHETLVAVKVLLDLEEAQKSAGPDAVWTLSNPILFNLQKVSATAVG